ncbi:MAG: DUF3810 domain-containing protein [Oscillospiraceae bacterium]|jgi:hypothetical protein|nr:DUF3810 domain-containing protein [Oscillospiraceae bacterium]
MKKVLIYLGITTAVNILIVIISRLSPDFSEWYAVSIYPLFVSFWGRINGIFCFAVVEILLYLLIAAAITGLVFLIIRLIKSKGRRKRTLVCAGLALSCAVSTLVLMFQAGGGINYQRQPFSYHSGLETRMYSPEDLRAVIVEVISELELLVPLINTCEDGSFILDKSTFNRVSRNAMQQLGELYPVLDTYYPNPKPIIFSRQIISPLMIGGVFSPFTLEALYNRDMPDSSIPFTALHELSHLSGFMREDEANFIAFLACRESGDVGFRYSGYMNALSSLIGRYDGDDLFELFMTIPEQVRLQYSIESDYWWSFYSAPGGAAIAAISTAVNDTYLIMQGQEDGVKSYGRVVDLLIADYLARNY